MKKGGGKGRKEKKEKKGGDPAPRPGTMPHGGGVFRGKKKKEKKKGKGGRRGTSQALWASFAPAFFCLCTSLVLCVREKEKGGGKRREKGKRKIRAKMRIYQGWLVLVERKKKKEGEGEGEERRQNTARLDVCKSPRCPGLNVLTCKKPCGGRTVIRTLLMQEKGKKRRKKGERGGKGGKDNKGRVSCARHL